MISGVSAVLCWYLNVVPNATAEGIHCMHAEHMLFLTDIALWVVLPVILMNLVEYWPWSIKASCKSS